MLPKTWQGCVFLLALFLVCNASGGTASSENSRPSKLAKIVQSKQIKHARVCRADPQLLSSLAGSGAEVMVVVPNEHLEHIADFQEEADIWVIANVARFLPTTKITHVLAGDDVLTGSPGNNAYFLVPAMLNLRSALAAAGLDGRVRVTSAMSAEALAVPAWSDVAAHLLRFLKGTGAPLFLKSLPSDASDAEVDATFATMRALGVSGVPVIAGELGARGGVATYYSYSYHPRGAEGGKRRSLATGSFCVALQNADPAALQAGLNWACGPGHADCSAIQPGGPCYKDNLPALASYAYNDYYQKQANTGASCSFNGTATTTTNDPSSGSCVFTGSSAAGASNSSTAVGASPPTSIAPPAGFTPPFGSSPPSSDFSPPGVGTTPPTGFTPPAAGGFGPPTGQFSPPSGGFGSPPSAFGPPGSFDGSGSFGPSGMLNPYGAGCRGAVSSAGLTALSAVAVAVVLMSMGVM